jgi:hypothetical protein
MKLGGRARQAAAQEALELERQRADAKAAEMRQFQEPAQRRRQEFMEALNNWAHALGVTPKKLSVAVTKTHDDSGQIDANIRATFECDGIRFFASAEDWRSSYDGEHSYSPPSFSVRLDRMGMHGHFSGLEEIAWKRIETLAELDKAMNARKSIIERMKNAAFVSSSYADERRHALGKGKDRDPLGNWH